ncbi:uncharacterized protein LOC115624469 [Scaptodrosophila lebanonensis]|uniref:Uncharacterized protein LOC115624469 n=1 Tax=Drosophila lebanonensis TaxID=7225 RepID=A0A6J2TJ18_DROLE|nr:uncharacterized protein LOC115624469 [Scaptodrosophila lebanonensis]
MSVLEMDVEDAYSQMRRLLDSHRLNWQSKKRRNRRRKLLRRQRYLRQARRFAGGQEKWRRAPGKSNAVRRTFWHAACCVMPFQRFFRIFKRHKLSRTQALPLEMVRQPTTANAEEPLQMPDDEWERRRSHLQERPLLENVRHIIRMHWTGFVERISPTFSSVGNNTQRAVEESTQRSRISQKTDEALVTISPNYVETTPTL